MERDIEMSIKPKTGGGARPGAPVGRKPGKPVANAAMTDKRKAVFLSELSKHGIVSAAARAASPHAQGTCAPSFYILRRNDPEFAAAWDDAIEQATGSVELELHRRAVEGYEEPVYQRGELVGTITKYSDRLLEIRAKALMPNKYIERRAVELSANLNVTQELYGGHALTLKPEDVLLLDEDKRQLLLGLLTDIAVARGDLRDVEPEPVGLLGVDDDR